MLMPKVLLYPFDSRAIVRSESIPIMTRFFLLSVRFDSRLLNRNTIITLLFYRCPYFPSNPQTLRISIFRLFASTHASSLEYNITLLLYHLLFLPPNPQIPRISIFRYFNFMNFFCPFSFRAISFFYSPRMSMHHGLIMRGNG